jgi:outer membrane protein OmpU
MIAIRDAWGEKRVIPNSDSPELGTTFDTRGKTMKKVLLATTALVLSAGVASAEMKLGGSGYVGMSGTTDDLNYDSRFQLQFDGSAESDSGVSVKARVRIRSNEDAGATVSAPRIDVTAGDLSLSFGNTSDAIDANTNAYASCVGNLGNNCADSFAGTGFSSTGGFVDRVRLGYTAGDISIAVSGQLDGGEDIAVSASGKMGAIGIAAGYKLEDATDAAYAVDVNGAFGTVNAGLRYDQAAGADAVASLYGNTTFGATTASIYVSTADANAWGVGMSHDLGGGIKLGAAMADGDKAEAHLSFAF